MTDELSRAGKRLQATRKAQREALEAARLAALAALSDGTAETEVATTLGVDRMTVRKWAGKR